MSQAQQYFYGHVPDHQRVVDHDLVHAPLQKLPGYVHVDLSANTKEISFEQVLKTIDDVPDQKTSSSCVGNATSTSVLLRAYVTGKPIVRPSRKGIYDVARLIDSPRIMLQDEGSRPAAAMLGGQQYGFCAESRWKLEGTEEEALELSGGKTREWINVEPPEDVFQHGIGATMGNYYRIAAGTGCAAGIRRAMISGYFPIFAMPVDQAYEDYSGDGIYQGMTGAPLGGHMQCVIGFGVGYILVCNSWSRMWGKGGLCLIADSWFDSRQVTDILVPTVVPGGVS